MAFRTGVLVLLVLAVGLAGCSLPGSEVDVGSGPETLTPVPVTESTESPAITPVDGTTLPPGVSRDGSVDLNRTISAHERLLSNESYRLHMRANATGTAGTDEVDEGHGDVRNASMTLLVENETTLYTDRGGLRSFADETGQYVRRPDEDDVRYFDRNFQDLPILRLDSTEPTHDLATRQFGPSESRVTPVTVGDRVRYRIHLPQVSAYGLSTTDEYRATIYVAPDGFVESLHVAYEVDDGTRYEFQFSYPRNEVGATTVTEPDWVAEAKQNESLTPVFGPREPTETPNATRTPTTVHDQS